MKLKVPSEWDICTGAVDMSFQNYTYYLWLWCNGLLYIWTLVHLFPRHNKKYINLGCGTTCTNIIWLFIHFLIIYIDTLFSTYTQVSSSISLKTLPLFIVYFFYIIPNTYNSYFVTLSSCCHSWICCSTWEWRYQVNGIPAMAP